MYWGIVVVTAVAFSCATEFIPEINTQLKLVPFTDDFKITMTSVMILDYMGCWLIEKALKLLFSDYKPKDIAVRRPDQLEKERKRLQAEQEAADREKEIAAGKA
jgi:cation-transporting ATPase 13A1